MDLREGRWAISRIIEDAPGSYTVAAVGLAESVAAYYPPLRVNRSGYVIPWALVRLNGAVGVPTAQTILLPDRLLDAPILTDRDTLVAALEARLSGYSFTDWDRQVRAVPAFSGAGLSGASTLRAVLEAVLAYAAHSEGRPKPQTPESHNTVYTDDFDVDSSSSWTNDGVSAYARDTTNGELDGSAFDEDSRLRYSANNPGSIEHETQVTGLSNSSTRAVLAGVRMQASPGDAYGLRVQNNGSGAQVLVLSRTNGGTRTDLLTTSTFGTLGNFVTVRLSAAGTAGSNVVLNIWRTDHGASKPGAQKWLKEGAQPDATYTDTAADRLDDSTHIYGGLAGRGPAGSGHDSRLDYWKTRALSDRPLTTHQSSQVGTGGAGSATATTASMGTAAAGDLVVAVCCWFVSGSSFSSITDSAGGNTWTQLGTEVTIGTSKVRTYYSVLTNGGSGFTVSFTVSSTSTFPSIAASRFSGGTYSAQDQYQAGTGNSSAAASGATGTRAQATQLLVGMLGTDNTVDVTISPGTNLVWNLGAAYGTATVSNVVGIEWFLATEAGTDEAQFSWTGGSDDWACRIATFAETAGAVTISTPVGAGVWTRYAPTLAIADPRAKILIRNSNA